MVSATIRLGEITKLSESEAMHLSRFHCSGLKSTDIMYLLQHHLDHLSDEDIGRLLKKVFGESEFNEMSIGGHYRLMIDAIKEQACVAAD